MIIGGRLAEGGEERVFGLAVLGRWVGRFGVVVVGLSGRWGRRQPLAVWLGGFVAALAIALRSVL